ncbi:hypothetical protein FQR65_LT08174 [Abscondita terminalis]|nr:hypothetical protein FQR65_LT08174 [Abscondita terminalis]
MASNDMKKTVSVEETGDDCELVAVEGGWGFIVALAVTVTYSCVIVPASVFGIVFGPFLASVGDETSGVSIVCSIFNTVFCFTGLAANHLLKKKTYREVGLLGAFLYFIGSFISIFVTSTVQLVLSWGVIQGLGFGLMLPAVFTAFNSYFNKKKTLTMNISQALVAIIRIVFPSLAKMSITHFGFRGTVAIISAYGLNCVPAMLSLHPVKWHQNRKPRRVLKTKFEKVKDSNCSSKPLLNDKVDLNNSTVDEVSISFAKDDIGCTISTTCKFLVDMFDLRLFKDWSFINLIIGLSIATTSDLAFVSLLPLLLMNVGCNTEEVATVVTVYFFSDLICRIYLSILTAVADINNRHLFLLGVVYSIVFRLVFVLNNSLTWVTTATAGLGFLHCLIHVPIPLIFAEAYPTKFSRVFSLFMVISGFVSLVFGPIIGAIKHFTGSLYMVTHFLTFMYLFCVIPWVVELIYFKHMKYILNYFDWTLGFDRDTPGYVVELEVNLEKNTNSARKATRKIRRQHRRKTVQKYRNGIADEVEMRKRSVVNRVYASVGSVEPKDMTKISTVSNGVEDVGTWKYVVMAGLILIFSIGLLQITPFGIIYGSLLAKIGNEIQDTATVNSVFTMMLLSAGLPANQLLQRLTYRKVTFIGAAIFCTGALLSTFIRSTAQLIFTFGILQGFGWGTMAAASLIVFTKYFNKRRTFYMNIVHLITSLLTISFPALTIISVNYYGERGTIFIVAAISSNVLFAALCFHPVEWHIKRRLTTTTLITDESHINLNSPKNESDTHIKGTESEDVDSMIRPKYFNWCYSIIKSFDLLLLKNPVYVNVAIGTSLTQSSDVMYISFLPILLEHAGFEDTNVSFLMTIYVISDLIGKIFLCFLSAFVKLSNRTLILVGAIGMSIFRLAQTFSHSFAWTALMCSSLGFVRAFVENNTGLVYAELFPERIVTSFSLAMVINAVVILILGQIINFLTSMTSNADILLIALSMAASCCAIPWTIELCYRCIKRRFIKVIDLTLIIRRNRRMGIGNGPFERDRLNEIRLNAGRLYARTIEPEAQISLN